MLRVFFEYAEWQANMSTAQAEFEKWFVESMKPLRQNGHAGFIFLFVAFPLLERYLRNKAGSRCPEGETLNDECLKPLGEMFPDIEGNERVFWDCYRNGLLHQVTFPTAKLKKKEKIWIELPAAGISGYDPRPVYFNEEVNAFLVNPITLFDRITTEIEENFSVYENADKPSFYSLPRVIDPSTAESWTTPTTGLAVKKSDL